LRGCAPAGGVNANAPGPVATSVFHFLTRSVYCGALLKVLRVITSLRGMGRRPRLHLELPVRVEVAKRKVLTLHAVDDPAADVFRFFDPGRKGAVRIGQQKIGPRQRDAMPLS